MSSYDVNEEAVRALLKQWIDAGDGVGVFENHDLSHPDCGRRVYIRMTKETAATCIVNKTAAPDGTHGLGWRYLFLKFVTSEEEVLGELFSGSRAAD